MKVSSSICSKPVVRSIFGPFATFSVIGPIVDASQPGGYGIFHNPLLFYVKSIFLGLIKKPVPEDVC